LYLASWIPIIAMAWKLSTPLREIPWIPAHYAEDLHAAGIETVEDLLYYLPIRYEDWREPRPIGRLVFGREALVRGIVTQVERKVTPRQRMKLLRAYLQDSTGQMVLVFFNQPYMAKRLTPGQEVFAYGEVGRDRDYWMFPCMQNPQVFLPEEVQKRDLPGRYVPIYRKVGRLTTRRLETLIQRLLTEVRSGLDDPLPQSIRQKYRFPDRATALAHAHRPPSDLPIETLQTHQDPAFQRLVYEDLFLLQLGLAFRRVLLYEQPVGIAFRVTPDIEADIQRLLPFELTAAQKRVLQEILADMQKPQPLHRLLQGDVGSGKTIIAAACMLVAARNGYQACLMAPTEILAEQHFYNLKRWFRTLNIPVALLIGGLRKREREEVLRWIAEGHAPIVVGTHALFQEDVRYARLGFVVIDEQHRFGVRHRARIRAKGQRPDTLVMTATPIPRSLALTLYGDLDVSVLDELPPGRQPVETRHVTTRHREDVYRWVARQLDEGHQAYIVCPLIEESEKLQVQAATRLYAELSQGWLRGYRLGLVHGQLKREDREAVMDAFVQGDLQALVATTVIEVGVDNPHATVMVIEHAERFGLAQLHQLRGRVGRGPARSYCILITPPQIGADAKVRIQALLEYRSGFDIAEIDLRLRGPGELAGVRQAGLARLRVADLVRDHAWIPKIRQDVEEYARRFLALSGEAGRQQAVRFLRQWARHYGLVQVG
jgi:ATP-dependent DNA helicase RecG